MKVTLNKTENRTTYLVVEPDALELETYIEKAYEHMSKVAEVPGYDKGNTPRDILEKHFSREKIIEHAIKALGYEKCSKILREKKIRDWLQPQVIVLQNEPPKFEIAVPLEPIVKLGDYHSMKVQPVSTEVTEKEIIGVLEKSRLQLANNRPVERSVKEGDLVELDIKGTASGLMFLDMNNLRMHVMPGSIPNMPDLYKEIIGMNKGEEKEFSMIIPEEYVVESLAGKEVHLALKIYDIREVTLPELNDDFAEKVAPGVGTLDKLKERVHYNMKKEKEQNAETKYKNKVVEMLIENSQIEYPPFMIEVQARLLAKEYYKQLESSCKDRKEYEQKRELLPEENVKENARPLARKRVLWSLVLEEFAKKESITVDDSEITDEIDTMTQDLRDEKRADARRYYHRIDRQNVEDLIRARKSINKLAEIVEKQSQ